jgi:hypothetical protein
MHRSVLLVRGPISAFARVLMNRSSLLEFRIDSHAITNQTLLAPATELESRLDDDFNVVLPRANKEPAKVIALVPMDLMIAISSMWMSRCDHTRYRETNRLHDGVGRY